MLAQKTDFLKEYAETGRNGATHMALFFCSSGYNIHNNNIYHCVYYILLLLDYDGNIHSQKQTEVITMTNERKIKNEEIKALAEKYSLAASDIEKGIEELEAEDIFLSADYIEDMIINGDLLPRMRQTGGAQKTHLQHRLQHHGCKSPSERSLQTFLGRDTEMQHFRFRHG